MMASTLWPRIVLFGDSITQFSLGSEGGWASLMADKLQRKCDVVVRGFSGYNTRWCRLILPKIMSTEDPMNIIAFTICLGANDSCLPELNPQQHVPIQEYQDNLVALVDELETIGVSRDKVILIGPPACDTEKWSAECRARGLPESKDDAQTARYSEFCKVAASRAGVDFVDFYSAMIKYKPFGRFLNDGLHLSQAGAVLLDGLLWPLIEKRTSHLIRKFPDWKNVDCENPKQSLL